ncbi:MAG: hypothetical protein JWP98_1863 [Edaphobacter sp.]|nr:hypothetical protein [Edaphobacter sp.]
MRLRDHKLVDILMVGFIVVVLALVWHFKRPNSVVTAAEVPKNTLTAGPQIAGCPIFPADNVWNTPIAGAKRDEHSDAYVRNIGVDKPLHPNFGSDPGNGIPITIIKPSVKYVKIKFLYSDESDQGNYPMSSDALIEGGPNSPLDSDRHIIMVDEGRCMLIEVGGVVKQPDGSWTAGAGIKMDLTSNALRPDGKTSTDAAGLPVLPGLLRYEDIMAGEVRHALRFTVPKTQRAFVWPARHFASRIEDPGYPPMGQRFRLKADVDISGYSKENQIILKGLKKYGMILSDNGSPWFLVGAPDKRWNDEDLHKLGGIKGTDFEAVDESDWQMHADSGRVDPMSLK